MLAEVGYLPVEELATLRKLGSRLQGHPDSTLPRRRGLHRLPRPGLSIAAGLALGAKLDAADGAACGRVFALTGDGELQEGQNWEAIMFAADRKLDNLVVIVDNNNLQIDGFVTDVCDVSPVAAKFEAFGLHAIACDGHDVASVRAALEAAVAFEGAPVAIVAKTVKGKGVSFMENLASWHGNAAAEQAAAACADLMRPARSFSPP